jgi:PAS domain-containing protein
VRVVCSYCHCHLRDLPGERSGVSHGMCDACAEHFDRLWAGISLSEYLEGLPHPVLVVDAEGRVAAANRAVGAMVGRDARALRGLLGGEAMACAHSRLPEGCGRTEHCRECAIRRTVEKVARTGRAARGVRAWLRTDAGTAQLQVSVEPYQGLFRVTVDDARPAVAA